MCRQRGGTQPQQLGDASRLAETKTGGVQCVCAGYFVLLFIACLRHSLHTSFEHRQNDRAEGDTQTLALYAPFHGAKTPTSHNSLDEITALLELVTLPKKMRSHTLHYTKKHSKLRRLNIKCTAKLRADNRLRSPLLLLLLW